MKYGSSIACSERKVRVRSDGDCALMHHSIKVAIQAGCCKQTIEPLSRTAGVCLVIDEVLWEDKGSLSNERHGLLVVSYTIMVTELLTLLHQVSGVACSGTSFYGPVHKIPAKINDLGFKATVTLCRPWSSGLQALRRDPWARRSRPHAPEPSVFKGGTRNFIWLLMEILSDVGSPLQKVPYDIMKQKTAQFENCASIL